MLQQGCVVCCRPYHHNKEIAQAVLLSYALRQQPSKGEIHLQQATIFQGLFGAAWRRLRPQVCALTSLTLAVNKNQGWTSMDVATYV